MSFVTYEPQGAVAYLIINRPEALNALNSQVLADLDAALDAIDLDAVRCLIVRGAGEKSSSFTPCARVATLSTSISPQRFRPLNA